MWHTPTPIHEANFIMRTPHFFTVCVSIFYKKNILDKQGSKIINLSLPEATIFACVGLTNVILLGLRSYEK